MGAPHIDLLLRGTELIEDLADRRDFDDAGDGGRVLKPAPPLDKGRPAFAGAKTSQRKCENSH